MGGGSPRSRIAGEVFTSTEYAQSASIPLHCEATYFEAIPEVVWFSCAFPPESGGETPLGDMRRVLNRLDPALVGRFAEKNLMYVMNLHGGQGFGNSWQKTYQSDNREEVEERIRAKGLEFEWTAEGGLRVIMRAPSIRTHSVTGRRYWGNQASNFHPGSLPPVAAAALARTYADPMHYPKMAYFGDGSPIPEEDIRAIVDVLAAEETLFTWRTGDVLVVDNQAIAHGRRPFKGKRQIMVSLTA